MWFWLFIVSTIINVGALLYVRWLLQALVRMNEDIESVNQIIYDFSSHLKSIHEMEMFYGDPSLQTLMKHASELSEKLENLNLILNEDQEEEKQEEADA